MKPIAGSVLADGHDVFLDECSLVAGDSLIERVPDAIAAAGVLILFLSEASKSSTWCKKELAIAASQMIKSGRLRVFAYRLERVDPPLIIDDVLYIDAVNLGYEESVERLSSPWLNADRHDRSAVLHCRHVHGSSQGPCAHAGVVDCHQ